MTKILHTTTPPAGLRIRVDGEWHAVVVMALVENADGGRVVRPMIFNAFGGVSFGSGSIDGTYVDGD